MCCCASTAVFQWESLKESRLMDAHRMGLPEQFWETVTAPHLNEPCCTFGIMQDKSCGCLLDRNRSAM